MEIVWHMHHCGDSVSEAGSQAGEEESERETGLEREMEREREHSREKTRAGKKRRRGEFDASLKLGQLHFQRLVLTK